MKNFLLSFVLTAASSCLLQLFLPWWIIAPVAFSMGYFFFQSSVQAFSSGFLAIFLLWIIYAWMLSSANENILAGKVAMLLPLKGNITALLLLTGIVGGLVSGFAALSGNLASKLMGK